MNGLPQGFLLCSEAQRERLRKEGRVLTYKNNEVVIEAGQFEPPALVALAGLVSVWNMGREADKVVTDFLAAPAPFFCGIYPRDTSPYELRSAGDSKVITFELPAFRSVLEEAPKFATWALSCLIRAQAQYRFYRARVTTLSLEARLAHFYWSLSAPVEGSDERVLRARVPQQVLCSYFGVAREEISRKRQVLERAGYVRPEGNNVLWLSPELVYLFSLQAPAPLENPWRQLILD